MAMMEFLTYDLKVAVLMAVFYMFYRLLLSRETFHCVNRMVLLLMALASFVLPLCVITIHKTVVVDGGHGLAGLDALGMVTLEEEQLPWWQVVLPLLYIIGVVTSLGYTVASVVKVCLLIRNSEQHPQPDGNTLCVTGNVAVAPFSWMHFIVVNRSDYEACDAAILAHEREHIRLHHSVDVLLVDMLTALQWFNPAMWMLRSDLRAIHEYEADAAVISQGLNVRQYQYLLIQKAVGACGYPVANGITHSTLKNRIHMMLNNKKTNRKSWLKLLALLPLVGIALALNAKTVNDYVYKDTQAQPQKKMVKKGQKDGKIKLNGTTIEVKTDTATVKGVSVNAELDKEHLGRPLFIVDGKLVDDSDEFLKNMDPATIDHIEVLKSDEAKGIYVNIYSGDAKDGVVIITTKEHAAAHKTENDRLAVSGVAQLTDDGDDVDGDVFDVVEKMPEYPGGPAELMKYLSENIHYPEEAFKTGKEGRVIVRFVIETDGSVTHAKVVKKVSDELDAEALRVVNSMQKWTPGKQNDKPVRVKYTLPISFRLR